MLRIATRPITGFVRSAPAENSESSRGLEEPLEITGVAARLFRQFPGIFRPAGDPVGNP
jgi:hypothetical protein